MIFQSKLLTSNIPRTDLRIAPDLALAHINAKFKDSQPLFFFSKKAQTISFDLWERERPAGRRVTLAYQTASQQFSRYRAGVAKTSWEYFSFCIVFDKTVKKFVI